MTSPGSPGLPLTPDGRIDADLLCTECSYNLRTLTLDASCPECGTTVVISARRDRLIDAPERFRTSLFDGARLLKLSVVCAFPLIYPGIALSCLAVWFLTRPQQDRIEPAFDRGYRVAARWLAVMGGVAVSVLAFGALVAMMGSTRQKVFGSWTYNDLPVFDLFFLVSHAIYVVGMLAVWRYLRILALRVPQPQLDHAFHRLGSAWLLTVLMIAGLCCATFGLNRIGVLPGVTEAPLVTTAITLVFMIALIALWVATLRVVTAQKITFKHLTDPDAGKQWADPEQG